MFASFSEFFLAICKEFFLSTVHACISLLVRKYTSIYGKFLISKEGYAEYLWWCLLQ